MIYPIPIDPNTVTNMIRSAGNENPSPLHSLSATVVVSVNTMMTKTSQRTVIPRSVEVKGPVAFVSFISAIAAAGDAVTRMAATIAAALIEQPSSSPFINGARPALLSAMTTTVPISRSENVSPAV